MPTIAAPIPESETPTGADAADEEAVTAGPSSAAENRKSERDDETGDTKRTAVEMSVQVVEMNNTDCNDEVTADPLRYQASEGNRRRVAARIEEAVEHATDCGDVDLIAAVQEAIESEKDEQEEPDEIWGGKEWLDPRLVREGRLDEVKRLKQATGQVVDVKWVDRHKGSVVRSRIVARQFATKSLEHLFAGTPDCRIWRRTRTRCCSWQTSHQRITRLQS